MLTFLFLVSLTATTLLLIAIAAEEALRVTQRLLARWSAANDLQLSGVPELGHGERSIRNEPSHADVRQFTQRIRASSQPSGRRTDEDQIPDRAA